MFTLRLSFRDSSALRHPSLILGIDLGGRGFIDNSRSAVDLIILVNTPVWGTSQADKKEETEIGRINVPNREVQIRRKETEARLVTHTRHPTA